MMWLICAFVSLPRAVFQMFDITAIQATLSILQRKYIAVTPDFFYSLYLAFTTCTPGHISNSLAVGLLRSRPNKLLSILIKKHTLLLEKNINNRNMYSKSSAQNVIANWQCHETNTIGISNIHTICLVREDAQ